MKLPIKSMGAVFLTAALSLWLICGRAAPADFELPGTQPDIPATPVLAKILHEFIPPENDDNACSNCHAGETDLGRPLDAWQGSMMAQAARDPLFYAQLDLTLDDPTVRPGVDGMADMCLRCHSPAGWLEGNSTDLTGMGFVEKDMFGVQCHVCHRLVNPALAGLDPLHAGDADPGNPDVANNLNGLLGAEGIPPTYGNGMYVVDRKHVRRGPYSKAQLTAAHTPQYVSPADIDWSAVQDVDIHDHPVQGSDFHRSGNLCGTCHDVSNPTDCLPGADGEDTQQCFPIERTWTEWRHSAFYARGEAGNCQSCHMSGPLNGVGVGQVCEGGGANAHLNDIHFHDLTGGNAFIPQMLIDMKERYETPSATICGADAACVTAENNFKTAVNNLYPPNGSSPFIGMSISALQAGIERVKRTLKRAAFLEITGVSPDLQVRVINRTGHKLPTGYPEGRRMWMNVKFLNAGGALLAESGRYDNNSAALYHDQNLDAANGAKAYDVINYTDAGGSPLGIGRPSKVWEARVDYDPGGAGAHTEFHFALNNNVAMDNRIPPEGWDPTAYSDYRAAPVIPALYSGNGWQDDYGFGGSPVHHDDIDYPLPAGTDRVELTLYYQTASREYAEALLSDNPNTLTAGGYNRGSLFYEAWECDGQFYVGRDCHYKSEPVVMARQVGAVADADGDGLSDGWEAANLTASPPAEHGYNDDPDADGLPNWQEFQEGSDPEDPASPAGVDIRDPVDIVLVLDMSGSMNSPAPGTTTPKIDILKESVTLFLENWKNFATPEDRIGVVYFRTDATPYGAGDLMKNFVAEWENILTDVQSQSAVGWTAMGAGVHTAVVGLGAFDPGNPRERHIILFSNGMQNRSPMITTDPLDAFPDHLYIKDQTAAENPDVTGGSNVTIGAGINYTIPLGPSLVQVHTIGIGVAENSGGTAWHELLQDLANQQSGKHNFITRAFELEGVFLEDLVASLKGNTPEYVLERTVTLQPHAEQTVDIPVNATAERVSISVTWDRQQQALPPQLSLTRPDGQTEDLSRITRGGDFYRVMTRYLTDVDSAPGEFGTWKLTIRNAAKQHNPDAAALNNNRITAPAADYRVHAIVEDSEFKYNFAVMGDRFRIGEPLKVSARALLGGRLLRSIDHVTVTLRKPGVSVGELLARSRATLDDGAVDQDLTATPFSTLAYASFSDKSFAGKLALEASGHNLNDQGINGDAMADDGRYTALLPTPAVPGHYELHFAMQGILPDGRSLSREETRTIVVQIGELDDSRSDIYRLQENGAYKVIFTPRDGNGNLLGPGYGNLLAAYVDLGGPQRLPVFDRLDGSYSLDMPPAYTPDAKVSLFRNGNTFHDGPVSERNPFDRIPPWFWWLLLLIILLLLGWLIIKRSP